MSFDDDIEKENDLDNLINNLKMTIEETDLKEYIEELESIKSKAEEELKILEESVNEEGIELKRRDLEDLDRGYWRSQF